MHNEHDTENGTMIYKRINDRAYELWMERGCPDGSPEEDWYVAEREIMGPVADADPPEAPFIYSASV
jgi:hypothetical protein